MSSSPRSTPCIESVVICMHANYDQSHKAATHLAMLTRFVSFSKMKGCCSNSRGYGLSVPLLIKLSYQPVVNTSRSTHHLSMKSLIPSDQTRPISGSSFIDGTGAVTIYDSSSIGATYADSPSGGKGKRRWAISCNDRPRDQTSALIE